MSISDSRWWSLNELKEGHQVLLHEIDLEELPHTERLEGWIAREKELLPPLLDYPEAVDWKPWNWTSVYSSYDHGWSRIDSRCPKDQPRLFRNSGPTQIHLGEVSLLSEPGLYGDILSRWCEDDIGEFPGVIDSVASVELKLPRKPLTLKPRWLAFAHDRKMVKAYNKAREAYWADQCKTIRKQSQSAHQAFRLDRREWSKFRKMKRSIRGTLDSTSNASEFWTTVMDGVAMPDCFPRNHHSSLDPESRVLVFDLALPDLSSLEVVKDRELKYETKVVTANKTETRNALSEIFFGYPIRVALELSKSRLAEGVEAIVVNSFVTRPDPRTGHERTDCIASVKFPIEDVKGIKIDKVDVRASYRHFKGVFGGEPQDMIETAPLLTFSEEESRFVEGREIAGAAEGTNLAAMDWEDFEHLIRELFEKEFGADGSEVRVTRASRDQGVDAIATDPDPIRGGKFIIQAKRWVNTVDVSAVRDLYGTVIEEGANRGILVTTSSFGRESHKFAEGKQLFLLNGDHLVQMLSKHGYDYFVDTKAARSLLNLD